MPANRFLNFSSTARPGLQTGIPPRCRMRRPFRGVSGESPYPFRIRKFVPLIRVTNTRRSYPLVRYAYVARIDCARTDAFQEQRDYRLVVYDASEDEIQRLS